MTQMDAIEIADGEHCGGGRCLRKTAINEHQVKSRRESGKGLNYNGFRGVFKHSRAVRRWFFEVRGWEPMFTPLFKVMRCRLPIHKAYSLLLRGNSIIASWN